MSTECFQGHCCVWGSRQPRMSPAFHSEVEQPTHSLSEPRLTVEALRTKTPGPLSLYMLPCSGWCKNSSSSPLNLAPSLHSDTLPLSQHFFSALSVIACTHFRPHPGWACRFLALSNWLWKTYKWERPLDFSAFDFCLLLRWTPIWETKNPCNHSGSHFGFVSHYDFLIINIV